MASGNRKALAVLLALAVVLFVTLAPNGKQAETKDGEGELSFNTLEELSDKRIAVQIGAIYGKIVEERMPEAEVSYFNTHSDLVQALLANKVDAFPVARPRVFAMMRSEPRLGFIDESFVETEVGLTFAKNEHGQALCEEVNEWLADFGQDAIESLAYKWTAGPEDQMTLFDYESLPATRGTIVVVTEGEDVPYDYVSDNRLVGLDIELTATFCRDRGYAVEYQVTSRDGMLMAVSEGTADMGASGMVITPERQESVLFSDPYYRNDGVMVVLRSGGTADDSTGGIAESFEKTFVREGRWVLFAQGVGTTLLITAAAVVFGTALGFAIYLMARGGNPVACALTHAFAWFVHGMPVVVLLMVLYYIVFGQVQVSGTVVSIIAFSLIFAAATYKLLVSGVAAVDYGQTEAALALGYPERRAFFRMILPQTIPHVKPGYTGEVTLLVKDNAVVGYIAVQDLTKMADIVRSRTYEAFFPLIATAVIYFVLEAVLGFVARKVSHLLDPRGRGRRTLLDGVDMNG